MEIFSSKSSIDFVRLRWSAFVLSGLMILASAISIVAQGINPGIDFSGGTLIQLRFPAPPPLHEIRGALTAMGLGDVVIQEFGAPEEIIIRVETQSSDDGKPGEFATKIVQVLEPLVGGKTVELRRVEFVGPQVGAE